MWYEVGRNRGGTKDPMLSERAADGGERQPRALFPKRRYGRRGQPDRGNWGTGGVEVVSRSDCWRQRMDHPVSLLHDCTRATPIVFTFHPLLPPSYIFQSHSIPFLYPLSRQSATGFLLAPTICFRARSPLWPRTKPAAIPLCNPTLQPLVFPVITHNVMAMGKRYKPSIRGACWLVLAVIMLFSTHKPYRREGMFPSQSALPSIRRHRDCLGGRGYDPLKGCTAQNCNAKLEEEDSQ